MRSLFAFFLMVAGLAACGGNAGHAGAGTGEALYLNNGQKWPVNAEMMPFIRRSGEQIDAFLATPGGDYAQLARDLKTNNEKLIASCTMQGEAHEVLHMWLLPHIALVKELEKAADANAANTVITNLKASMTTFGQYFQ
jgi:hypothetical protein